VETEKWNISFKGIAAEAIILKSFPKEIEQISSLLVKIVRACLKTIFFTSEIRKWLLYATFPPKIITSGF